MQHLTVVSCSAHQTYGRPCISLHISAIWRATPVIFPIAILQWPIYSMIWTLPPSGAPSRHRGPLKTPDSTKCTIFDIPCTKFVEVGFQGTPNILRGPSGYSIHASRLFYVHIFGRQRAHNGGLCENLALPGSQIPGYTPSVNDAYITACTVVQAVVKANRKNNGKIVVFCDHMFLVVRSTYFFIHRIALRPNR